MENHQPIQNTNINKNILFLILLLQLKLTPIHGQLSFKTVDWQFQAGLQIPQLNIKDKINPTNYPDFYHYTQNLEVFHQNRLGFFASLVFKKPADNPIQLSSGLQLRYQESYRSFSSQRRDKEVPLDLLSGFDNEGIFKVLYLTIPLSLQGNWSVDQLKISIGGGGYYNIRILGYEKRTEFEYRFFEEAIAYNDACRCNELITKTPTNQEDLYSYKRKKFILQNMGLLANIQLRWPLKNGRNIGFHYGFMHDLQKILQDFEFIAPNSHVISYHFATHQLGLTYQLSKEKSAETVAKPLAKNLFLGLSIYLLGLHDGSFSYGPSLNIGFFLNQKKGFESIIALIDSPKENFSIRSMGLDFNYLYMLSPVLYSKIGLSSIISNYTHSFNLIPLTNLAPQIGAGGLIPINQNLRLKWDTHGKYWVRNVIENRFTVGLNFGFVFVL